MKFRFVPLDFYVPNNVILLDKYILRFITTEDVEEDYQVITKNADTICQIRGGGSRTDWPYTCTYEENLKDLAWLEVCASYNQLFRS